MRSFARPLTGEQSDALIGRHDSNGRGNPAQAAGVGREMNARSADRHPASLGLLGAVLIVAGVISACTARSGGVGAPTGLPSSETPTPAAATQPPPSTAPDKAAAPSDCPVTLPHPAFHAPTPYPELPPARYRSAWYGTDALWTMLDVGGEVWAEWPPGGSGIGQKTFWWSTAFDELEPSIVVSAERLDAPGTSMSSGPGTNASADFGLAMLQGIEIPSGGCWRLTGSYRGATLSYVVWVEPSAGG